MIDELKQKFPDWCSDTNTHYSLCLQDDVDSLLSACLLKHLFNYPIEWFYDFNAIGCIDNLSADKCIGCDMDLVNNKRCWGNHVRGIDNPKSANLNNNITLDNYYSKYSGSTFLTLLSFHGININNFSEEAKMVLMTIDGAYKPFRIIKIDFSGTAKEWLTKLGYPELIDLMAKHQQHEFENLIGKYRLNAGIDMTDGYLSTDIDIQSLSKLFKFPIELPKQQFNLIKNFHNVGMNIADYQAFKKELLDKGGKIFSQAVTNKNFIKLSYEL